MADRTSFMLTFNVRWYQTAQAGKHEHVCVLLRLWYMISRNLSKNICADVQHCLIWAQKTNVCMLLFFYISSKYWMSSLAIVPPVVTNIFPCKWFNGAFYIFDQSPEGRMYAGHSWYFVNWSESIGCNRWYEVDLGIYCIGRKQGPFGTFLEMYWCLNI